jgi:hypothetical protein
MSGYQYYEFLAIDRPLSADEMSELQGAIGGGNRETPEGRPCEQIVSRSAWFCEKP